MLFTDSFWTICCFSHLESFMKSFSILKSSPRGEDCLSYHIKFGSSQSCFEMHGIFINRDFKKAKTKTCVLGVFCTMLTNHSKDSFKGLRFEGFYYCCYYCCCFCFLFFFFRLICFCLLLIVYYSYGEHFQPI